MADQANLFVYGTLRRGFDHPMARLLEEDAKFLGQAFFQGRLFDLGPYPVAVCTDQPGDKVAGDLYALKDATKVLAIMDEYEGVGEPLESGVIYKRSLISVELKKGKESSAWIYHYDGYTDHLVPISGGDYLKFMQSRK